MREKRQDDSTNVLNSYAAATDSVPVKPLIKLDFPTEGKPLQKSNALAKLFLCWREEGFRCAHKPDTRDTSGNDDAKQEQVSRGNSRGVP